MTDGPIGSPESSSAPASGSPAPTTAGTRLRVAREAAGLTLDDVAQQLKLARRQVIALESDDVAALPGPTFVRGFIRNYARLLRIDAGPLLEASKLASNPPTISLSPAGQAHAQAQAHAHAHEPAAAPTITELPVDAPRESRGGVARWLIPTALVLLLAAGAGYYQFVGIGAATKKSARKDVPEASATSASTGAQGAASTPAEATPATTEGQSSAPAAGAPAAASQGAPMAASAGAPGSATTSTQQAPGASSTNSSSATSTANPVVPAAAAPGQPGAAGSGPTGEAPEGRLELEFAGQAWVEVRDKYNDVLLSRTMPPRSKQLVRGEPPFTLRVGNASAVTVVLDGRPVDLTPYTRNEIAKVVLPSPHP